jgi:hypothetical protein
MGHRHSSTLYRDACKLRALCQSAAPSGQSMRHCRCDRSASHKWTDESATDSRCRCGHVARPNFLLFSDTAYNTSLSDAQMVRLSISFLYSFYGPQGEVQRLARGLPQEEVSNRHLGDRDRHAGAHCERCNVFMFIFCLTHS